MLKNYFTIAVRNILRSKVYSIINILGLSLGIACCLLLALYVQDEFSFDRHHERLGDLYRINTDSKFGKMGSVSPPIAMALRDEIPEVESAVRILKPPGVSQSLIQYEDQLFYESDGYIADSTLFEVLTFDLTEGNAEKALTDANTVVLSDKLAKKLFGNEPALDKSILISQGFGTANYKITGVFSDTKNSFLHASFFTSMMSDGWGQYLRTDPGASNEWAGQNFVPSYVKLVKGHNKEAVDKKINDVLIKHGAEAMKGLGLNKTLFLEPLEDIYLRSVVDKNPRITYIYVIVSIAVFILLIACINFMNLSTAKAMKRSTEIGVRKVMGAFRSSLIRQILGEALIVVMISMFFSVVFVQLALPFFNELSGKSFSFNSENIVYFSLALAALAIITGLLAGSYPAFYMSSFQPAQVLKGKFNASSSSGRIRQVLVVFQFMIAIVLVCGMIVISRQLSFMQEQDLGFNANAKVVLPLRTDAAKSKYEVLKKELQQTNGVMKVSGAEYVPGSPIFNDMMYYTDGGSMETATDIVQNSVDVEYLDQLGIKLIAGRAFTDNRASESQGKVIINKLTAAKFGFAPDKMIGQLIHYDWQGKNYSREVVGVMDDFNQTSLKDPIVPTLFRIPESTGQYRYLVATVEPGRFEDIIASVEKKWKSLVIDTPFEFNFLEDNIQKQYDQDRKMATIITTFTIIAMIISSLGLYGLSTFMAERRFKEIGVRKVLGASVSQIAAMMSKEFIKLVCIAFLLSVPLAWYAVNQWLEGFAYKVPIDVTVFAYAGLIAIVIALVTVSFQSIRAASTNPANSLRSE